MRTANVIGGLLLLGGVALYISGVIQQAQGTLPNMYRFRRPSEPQPPMAKIDPRYTSEVDCNDLLDAINQLETAPLDPAFARQTEKRLADLKAAYAAGDCYGA